MKNLKNKIKREKRKELAKIRKDIKAVKDVEFYKNGLNYLNQFITPYRAKKGFKTLKELRTYLNERATIKIEKDIQKEFARIEAVTGYEFEPVEIVVEWKKNRTWGSNPRATAFVPGVGYIDSGSIGGCGYDKQSTAVAEILNQIPAVMYRLYKEKNRHKNINKTNHEIFGYGSGYGILPAFEGGVGVNCYPAIFDKIVLKFETVHSSKNTDIFRITKK